jgi:two-component system, chemotaxis family, protein-glutamate methylesterase/glutaminase
MAHHEHRHGAISAFICPECGGALRKTGSSDGLRLRCRSGDTLSTAELWIEHCAARNAALKQAHRALAENVALARKLAAWTRARGNEAAASRLEHEAADDQRLTEQVASMLEGLRTREDGTVDDLEGGEP